MMMEYSPGDLRVPAFSLLEDLSALNGLSDLDEPCFRRMEFDLVYWFKLHEEDQPVIAAAVTACNLSPISGVGRERITEILQLLDTVNDPLIW